MHPSMFNGPDVPSVGVLVGCMLAVVGAILGLGVLVGWLLFR